ncbi:cytochrome P450, partial [Amylocystis lapponica]
LCSFVLAMALHPLDVQKKAQAAVNAALQGRLPDFSHLGRIPYVDALVNEVLRWNPIAPPLGMFHAANKDDSYTGYTIPRCTGVVVVESNCDGQGHDEARRA